MQRRYFLRLLTPLVLIPATLAHAGDTKPYTPKTGSPERKAIMDALRVPVEKEVKQKVVFQIDALRLQDSWAFLSGKPTHPDGSEVDYSHTRYSEALKAGAFSRAVVALMKRSSGGTWKVVTYRLGPTDVPYVHWDRDYHCPHAILGLPPGAQ